MMTKLFVASLLVLGLSAGAVAKEPARAPRAEEQRLQMSIPEPQPMSCKASGQPCGGKDECCSSMCTKGKCS